MISQIASARCPCDQTEYEGLRQPDLKTTGHVCGLVAEKTAWFANIESNIQCVHERVVGKSTGERFQPTPRNVSSS
jgi:hypothetical protein